MSNSGRCSCGALTSLTTESGIFRCGPCYVAAAAGHEAGERLRSSKQAFEDSVRAQVDGDPAAEEALLKVFRDQGPETEAFRLRVFGRK